MTRERKAKGILRRDLGADSDGGRPEEPHQKAREFYDSVKARLEVEHYGQYVMIHLPSQEYVVGRTTSDVHARFIQRFGIDAPGWCTRIGASAFATT